MEIKLIIGICSLTFFCDAVVASPIFSIDPTQSYVKAYVPSWSLNPNSGSIFVTPDGSFISLPAWELHWDLTSFPLSGNFVGTTEMSPWAPDVGHFVISQEAFTVDTPNSITLNPPSSFTFYQSTGGIVYDTGPCSLDPFYGPPPPDFYCTGFSSGYAPYMFGEFDSGTLDIQGGTGGPTFGLFYETYFGDTPPSIDPTLIPNQYTYKIFATSIPEPSSVSLVFLGIVALYQVNNRRKPSIRKNWRLAASVGYF